jgi:hypothetical protein
MKIGVFAVDFEPDLFVEMGVDSLIFPFDTPNNVLREATKDFEVFVEFKPFEGGVVEDVFGRRAQLDALGCPSDKEVIIKNFNKLKGVEYEPILDFVRFPAPSNRDFFFSGFCDNCAVKAKELGYDLHELRMKVKRYLETDDLELLKEWFDFKKEVISDYFDFSGLKRAFFFTPSLSFLVGQSYELGITIYPMIYPGMEGPACIDYELSNMQGSLKEEVLRRLGARGEEVIEREVAKGLALNKRIEPIIMISEDIRKRLEMTKKASKTHIFAYSRAKRALFERI